MLYLFIFPRYSLASSLEVSTPIPQSYLNSRESKKVGKKATVKEKVDSLLKPNGEDKKVFLSCVSLIVFYCYHCILQLMKKCVLTSALEKQTTVPPYEETLRQARKRKKVHVYSLLFPRLSFFCANFNVDAQTVDDTITHYSFLLVYELHTVFPYDFPILMLGFVFKTPS
jgi:hypothetical protein